MSAASQTSREIFGAITMGTDPTKIVGTSGDLAIAKAMKKKYKLEKKQRVTLLLAFKTKEFESLPNCW